jgi:hypothetical protein
MRWEAVAGFNALTRKKNIREEQAKNVEFSHSQGQGVSFTPDAANEPALPRKCLGLPRYTLTGPKSRN